jgi:hypothetical protein
MNRVLRIPDDLYVQLETISHSRGLSSIEELLKESVEIWQIQTDDVAARTETVRRIDALREELFAKYGEQADSVELIRSDRER